MDRDAQRALAVALATAGALFGTAGTAGAATSVTRSGGTLNVTAASAKENRLTVSRGWRELVVRDRGDAVSAGAGCVQTAPDTATCAAAEIVLVAVDAGDLTDFVTKTAPVSGRLDGGDGSDSLSGGPTGTWNELIGGKGGDTLIGGPDIDVLDGGDDVDTIHAGAGDDTLRGGPGDDLLISGAGADRLEGGTGSGDTAQYAFHAGPVNVSLDGLANDGEAGEGDNVGLDVEEVIGSPLDDVLTGGAAGDELTGGAGNDTLTGAGGDDTLKGGPGRDTHDGGAGRDTLLADSVPDGTDVFIGGSGPWDRVSYATRSTALRVEIGGLTSEGDDVRSDVEQVAGGAGDDRLIGNAQPNVLLGGGGTDILEGRDGGDDHYGEAGDDYLLGGPGDDTFDGGPGGDSVHGDIGRDRIDYSDRTYPLTVTAGDNLANDGQIGEHDSINNTVEIIAGGSGSDTLIGGTVHGNLLIGGLGNDHLDGGLGDDTLLGGLGFDTCVSEAPGDVATGCEG